jgi:hypothetical protein
MHAKNDKRKYSNMKDVMTPAVKASITTISFIHGETKGREDGRGKSKMTLRQGG